MTFRPTFYRAPSSILHTFIGLVSIVCIGLFVACGSESPQPDRPTTIAEAAPRTPSERVPGPTSNVVRPKIVAFGDSLTAGYGLEKSMSYPALLQQALDERGYNYEVVNAGVSGETTKGGVRRIDRFLDDDVQIVIVELGANDGLRGLPVRDLKANLVAMIEKAQSKNITVVLAGMEAPPHLGPEYTNEFRQAFRDVAEEYDVPLIPFFLDGVAGRNDMNQMDGIHPNARGTAIVTDNVLSVVEPLLAK